MDPSNPPDKKSHFDAPVRINSVKSEIGFTLQLPSTVNAADRYSLELDPSITSDVPSDYTGSFNVSLSSDLNCFIGGLRVGFCSNIS